ncbi:hypothetical protein BLOT_004833 [Blomia tropicalis]|nr:hypothetical protein BLOT_004833 [Blomia tropicalis]
MSIAICKIIDNYPTEIKSFNQSLLPNPKSGDTVVSDPYNLRADIPRYLESKLNESPTLKFRGLNLRRYTWNFGG